MRIRLYLNSAENNRLDKSAYLQEVMTLDGNLREPSSIITPTITFNFPSILPTPLIDEDDEEIDTIDGDIVIDSPSILKFNYVYIEDFARYYYVSDIVIQRTGLYVVSLVVDPLMSFKDNLLNLPAFIDRNEFAYNDYLEDKNRPLEEKTEITIEEADRGNITFSTDENWLDNSNPNFVMNMIVCDTYFYGKPIDIPWTQTDKIYPKTFQGGNTIPYVCNWRTISRAMNRVVAGQGGDKVSDFVASIIAFPFRVPYQFGGSLVDIHYEKMSKTLTNPIDGTNLQGYIPNGNTSDFLVVGYLNIPRITSFLDLPPYTRREIYLPFYGWYDLDIQKTAGHQLIIYYVANYQDGSAMVYIRDNTNGMLVFSTSCQLGVKIPTTQTNLQEIAINKNALNTQLAISLVSSAVTMALGGETNNMMMVAGGAMAIPSSINNYVASMAKQFHHASVSFGGGAMALYSPLRVYMRTTKLKSPPFSEDVYAHEFGKPYASSNYLYELSGFTIVQNIHLENLSAFKSEKDEIERLLKSGIIL